MIMLLNIDLHLNKDIKYEVIQKKDNTEQRCTNYNQRSYII